MFNVVITEKGGGSRTVSFDTHQVNIGRSQRNDIVLAKGNISKLHSRIVFHEGKLVIADLGSRNGTYVNSQRISAPRVIRPTDVIRIGDYTLRVAEHTSEMTCRDAARAQKSVPDEGSVLGDPAEDVTPRGEDEAQLARAGGVGSPAARETSPRGRPKSPADPRIDSRREHSALQKEIHDRLIEHMDLRRLDIDKLGDEELWKRTEKSIRDILDQMEAADELGEDADRDQLLIDVLNEALGLGPLEAFLDDDDVSEIMVNHAHQIYVERKGKIQLSDRTFSSNQAVLGVIERIVAPIGRRIDESSPLVDARLKDGSRVNAIIPPLTLKGPCITIRKFRKEKLKIEDLIRFETLSPQMAEFLKMCVTARRNIVISGGTGSGKTTTLNIVSNFIPDDERIVTVEDAAELQLSQEHWVQLESRPPNIEGKGQITIRDLVKNCLRMRPDRIVVGECRSGETLDMLQAMNTGHDGSLTTLHANSPRDAIARMETMVMMAGMELPLKAIRDQIASAVNIIVQQTRFSDGTRKIAYITEVTGMEVDVVTMQDLFVFKQEGFDENNRVRGRFVATGFIPRFFDDLQRRGIPVNMSIFHSAD